MRPLLRALAVTLLVLAFGSATAFASLGASEEADAGLLVERNDLGVVIPQGATPKLLLRFAQVSDAHVLDDDAPYPLRWEAVDPLGPPVESAQRPQEEYTDEMTDAVVRAVNALNATSPVAFLINTGDNVDNSLENEVMRFVDLMRGTVTNDVRYGPQDLVPDGQSTSVQDGEHDERFRATGLPPGLDPAGSRVPVLAAFGNHDTLVQGNVNPYSGFNGIAGAFGRYLVNQQEYIALHFPVSPCMPGWDPASAWHGLGYGYAGDRLCDADPENDGYYSFDAGGVHHVVLDTVNDDWAQSNGYVEPVTEPATNLLRGGDRFGGYASGTIDADQLAWLEADLDAHAGTPTIVYAHHTINSFYVPDSMPEQFGFQTGATMTDFLASHTNVIAFVGGHTHQNRIQPKIGENGRGFWNVETSSVIDAPSEFRVIEVWDAGGGVGYLDVTLRTHDYALGHALMATDPQHDAEVAAGTAADREVRLWFEWS